MLTVQDLYFQKWLVLRNYILKIYYTHFIIDIILLAWNLKTKLILSYSLDLALFIHLFFY